MTDKQYVTRAAKMMKLDLIAPTRACPGIIATAWVNGFGKNVIDAQNWPQAREQINTYARQRANA
jgi:hypothetical protein